VCVSSPNLFWTYYIYKWYDYAFTYGSIDYNINTNMRYHVIYKKGTVKPFYGTQWTKSPSYITDSNKLLEITTISDNDADYKNIITWQLNDLPLTRKFIDFYKTINNHAKRFKPWGGEEDPNNLRPPGFNNKINRQTWHSYRYRLELFKSNFVQDFLDSRVKMNELIDYLNIDPKLKLDTTSIFGEINKLNRLHEIFEKEVVLNWRRFHRKEITKPQHQSLNEAWEAVNYIVHMNEKTRALSSKQTDEFNNNLLSEDFMYSTTLATEYLPPGDLVRNFFEFPLQDEDYKHFTLKRTGQDLFLDYGTVGKDLLACYSTNDVELASDEEKLSQQITYNPWVGYEWQQKEIKLDEYNKWIRDNNIDKNIDLTQAKFTPGRHPLSTEFISHPHIKDPKTFYNEIIKITPLIDGWCITDDNNQKVL